MIALIKVEELFLFVLSLFLFGQLEYDWWIYPALILVPDISIAGYLAGPRWGAVLYNFVHHKALSISLYVLGSLLSSPGLMLTGVILLGHSSLDRALGFGLKRFTSFKETHLGVIGD